MPWGQAWASEGEPLTAGTFGRFSSEKEVGSRKAQFSRLHTCMNASISMRSPCLEGCRGILAIVLVSKTEVGAEF